MRVATAFAPAHVTGFFSIHDQNDDPLYKGSRGAGFSLEKGVVTHIKIEEAQKQEITILFNGSSIDGPVTRTVIENILGLVNEKNYRIIVEHKSEFNIGTGFGLSAAGALSTALALTKALDIHMTITEIGQIAHKAEIANKTGLGDVIAEIYGGFEIRKVYGGPGVGVLDFIPYPRDLTMVAAVFGPISTKSVLTDTHKRRKITLIGDKLVDKLLEHPTVEYFLQLSQNFAKQSGLITQEISRYLDLLEKRGITASMIMIGNAVFTLTREEDVEYIKRSFLEVTGSRGKIIVSRLLPTGVFLIDKKNTDIH